MSKINLSTLLKRAGYLSAIAAGIVVLWGGCKGVSYIAGKSGESDKLDNVEYALRINEPDSALKLLEGVEKGTIHYPARIADLKGRIGKMKAEKVAEIDKKAGIAKLEDLLGQYNLPGAVAILEDLKKSGRYTGAEISSLEKKMDEIKEEGLYEKVVKCSGEEKLKAARNYLRVYPEGKERKEVILEQLSAEYSLLYDEMKASSLFSPTFARLKSLNLNLAKFSTENIVLSDKVPLDAITSVETNYLIYAPNQSTNLVAGAKVRITGNKDRNWNEAYVAERSDVVKTGTVGEIMGINDEKQFVVKFPNIPSEWKTDWFGIAKSMYELNGKRFVAWYKPDEIVANDPLTDFQKYQFANEMKKLRKNLEVYK